MYRSEHGKQAPPRILIAALAPQYLSSARWGSVGGSHCTASLADAVAQASKCHVLIRRIKAREGIIRPQKEKDVFGVCCDRKRSLARSHAVRG